MKHRLLPSGITIVLGLFLWAYVAMPVDAHWADQAVAEITVADQQVEMLLTFPTGLVTWADANRDGELSPPEIGQHRARLHSFLSERVQITDRGMIGALTLELALKQLPPSLSRSASHSTLRLIYRWSERVTAPVVRYDLFLPGVSTASCLATIVADGRVQNVVFTPEHRQVAINLGGSIDGAAAGFVLLGIRHIFTGYDHVLFLISLVLLGGGLRALLKIVTAFTFAHSITLSLAVLGIVTLPPRWVESAIALSIVYVATENLWRRELALRYRWLLTFGFGLVHGLGFASILTELNLPRAGLVTSLVSFNVGVEIGQVVIVALAALSLQLLRAWPKQTLFRLSISAGAAVAGFVWFLQRALLGS